MNRAVVDCPIGCRGADLSTRLTADEASGLRQAGFQFVTRYVSITTPHNGDLSPGETVDILEAGLGLMVVQHVRFPGWTPSASLGTQDGTAAGRNAITAGIPKGATLWADLEGTAPTATAGDVNAYVAAWVSAVQGDGYEAGAYIGSGLPANLDGEALWHLAVERYWRSESAVPNVTNRGYQMVQLYPECRVAQVFPDAPASVRDIMVDVDVAQSDYRRSVPRMVVSA